MAQGSSNPSSNLLKVAGTAVDTNTGNASAGTQRVVLATNQPTIAVSLASVPSHAVTGTFWQATQPVSGTFYQATQPVSGTFWQATQPISGTVSINAIPTGANAIGSITNTSFAATQSGTWNIGTVTNLSQLGGTAISMNTGVRDAGTQRVTIATNDSVPISGTVELGAASLTALENINVTIPGTVDLGTISLTALETITVISGTPGNFQSRGYGSVTTAAPTYITGTDNAFSLTTTGALRVDNSAVTQPVSGTFYQATQPVSLASVPTHGVTGTFWQTTQPVSGTFWQTTQPVSGPLTNTELRAAAVPVSQSGTWTVQPGNTANTTPWLIKPLESLGTATALGALNAEITQALNGNLGAAVVLTATAAPVGVTLTPYASYDGGTNWSVTQFFNSANGDAITSLTAFAVGDAYSLSAGDGATHVKVRATGWTSGSVTAKISASNSQGLVNLKSTAVHDDVAGSFVQQMGAVASSTAPTAVNANGDAVRLWATTSGALNIADGGGSITVDGTFYQATQPVSGTFYQATQPVSLASVPTHGVTGTFWQATQPVSGTFWQATQPVSGTVTVNALPASTNVIGTVNLAGATTNALTNTTTTAYASSLIIKASAGTIYTLNGFNSKTSGQFIQLHNSATLPADAAVPVVTFYVPASSNFSFDWGVYGRSFSAGIVVTTSSTGPTKTIGAADCWFDATSK